MKHAMATTVDATGVDIYHLIASLWTHQKVAAFFQNAPHLAPPIPTRAEVEGALNQQRRKGYIDYINGRAIKCDFSDMSRLDASLYDRDAGKGTFQSVVNIIRPKK
jgi:hypothetical protein